MTICKKILRWCAIIVFCFPLSHIEAKGKITGILASLFPLPVYLYNAGCDEALSFDFSGSQTETKTVTFDDVAGLDGAKEDLKDIIAYLKDSDKFIKMGAKIPKGILLNGAPGNGKTLLARAFAGQANCSFMSVNGSDFNSEYMGINSQKIKDLFQDARKQAPCVIFFDEIDAIASKRSDSSWSASRDDNKTLITLLAEMDGFDQYDKPIIVIAATNRVDQLDPAIIRPGRFDRIVEVNKPFVKDRAQLLRIALAKTSLSDDVNIEHLAQGTTGFSGAELVNLVNEAIILAIKDNSNLICMKHIEMAYDNITLGRETKGMQQSQQDLWHTAIHEAGHLIGYLFQDKTVAVRKVSITPRGKTLGVAHMLPLVESYSYTQDDMKNQIVACLAGRFAEEAFGFGLSSGAWNDLEQARNIAYDMVVTYGMSENLRDISYRQFDDQLPNDIATVIHNEVNKIIEKCRSVTRNLIADHKKDIEKIAKLLMQKGTVQGYEIYELLHLPQPQFGDL
jgi:cell division protease FtsH